MLLIPVLASPAAKTADDRQAKAATRPVGITTLIIFFTPSLTPGVLCSAAPRIRFAAYRLTNGYKRNKPEKAATESH